MRTITLIMEADADGTLHLPLPEELRHGRIEVTATLKAADRVAPANGKEVTAITGKATQEMLRVRREAFRSLRASGGLGHAIADPVAWQRELREDRPLPGRG